MEKKLSLKLIHENSNVLVVDKPHGIVVNISKTSPKNTIQDVICDYLNFKDSLLNEVEVEHRDFLNRCGIVHRLDKDTSGVLVIAKNESTFLQLQDEFKKRKVQKEYLALVFGEFREDYVEVNAGIKRDPKNRIKYAISKEGKAAKTKIEKMKNVHYKNNSLSLLKVYPKTGRTHQIRVHLLALNHPVVGDKIYSSKNQIQLARDIGINRMMLHARKISINGEEYEAEIPEEFQIFMKT